MSDEMSDEVFVGQNDLWEHSWKRLYLDSKSADVFFVFGNDSERIPAHKFIMSLGSPVFDAMFNGRVNEQVDVLIVDATSEIFKEFLQFFYLTKVRVTSENIVAVMNLCKTYDLAECLHVCENVFKQTLSINEMCWAYGVALQFESNNLIEFCEKNIRENAKQILSSDGFLDCNRDLANKISNLVSTEGSASEVKDDADLICDRRSGEKSMFSSQGFNMNNSQGFSSNTNLLLTEFYCIRLSPKTEDGIHPAYNYTIFTAVNLKPLVSGSLTLSKDKDARVILSEPFLIIKDIKYLIRFDLKSQLYWIPHERLQKEIQLGGGIEIKFFWEDDPIINRMVFRRPDSDGTATKSNELVQKRQKVFECDNDWARQTIENSYLEIRNADLHLNFPNQSEMVPVHRMILGDSVFENLMRDATKENDTILISDIPADVFKEFAQFFYLTEVRLRKVNIFGVMKLCKRFNLQGFYNVCERAFKTSLCIENAYFSYELAESAKDKSLTEFCKKKIQSFVRNLLLTSDDFLLYDDNGERMNALIAWTEAGCKRYNLHINPKNMMALKYNSPFLNDTQCEDIEKMIRDKPTDFQWARRGKLCDRRMPGESNVKTISNTSLADYFWWSEKISDITGICFVRLAPSPSGEYQSLKVKIEWYQLPEFELAKSEEILLTSDGEMCYYFEDWIYSLNYRTNAIHFDLNDKQLTYIQQPLQNDVTVNKVKFSFQSELITQISFKELDMEDFIACGKK